MTKGRIQTFLKRNWAYFALVPFVLFTLFPFAWMAMTSIETDEELYDMSGNAFILEKGATSSHYLFLLTKTLFKTWFANSLIVSSVVVLITILISIPAAYSLARIKFPGASTIGTGIFLTYLIPPTLLFIPLYTVITFLRTANSLLSLIVTYPTFTIPFSTWLLIGFFSNLPRELEEAAMIDGASWLQSLVKIVLPLSIPGVITSVIFCFTASWGHLIYALAFVSRSSQQTLPVALISKLIRGDVFFWGALMAAGLLASVPVVIIYAFLLDYYVAGLTKGAMKF